MSTFLARHGLAIWLAATCVATAVVASLAGEPRNSPPLAAPTGGAYGHGRVFHVVGSHDEPIYDFCADPDPFGVCGDGAQPVGNVLTRADGSLVGVTAQGGTSIGDGGPAGTVYVLTPHPHPLPGMLAWTIQTIDLCTWFADCDHYGAPVGAVWFETPGDEDKVDVVLEEADGSGGSLWRVKLAEREAHRLQKWKH